MTTALDFNRRQRRAHTAPMAVGYQLLHLAEQLSLRAIVVADDVGVALAHAGDRALSTLLADAAMWGGFGSTSVDEMTLARIQERFPEIELEHVASRAFGGGGVTVLAIGSQTACRAAVRRAAEGIARICTVGAIAGPVFLAPEACANANLPADAPARRESGVLWAIGGCR